MAIGDALERTDVRVKIVWGLYILAVVTGGPIALLGVILAYIWRRAAGADPLATHFGKQIRVFWITVIGTAIGLLLVAVLVGFLIIGLAALYMFVMSVVGILRALDGKPWP